MRQNGLETGFWGGGRWAQSGALSAKPRVVRGSGRLRIALSEFEVKLLAEQDYLQKQTAKDLQAHILM